MRAVVDVRTALERDNEVMNRDAAQCAAVVRSRLEKAEEVSLIVKACANVSIG